MTGDLASFTVPLVVIVEAFPANLDAVISEFLDGVVAAMGCLASGLGAVVTVRQTDEPVDLGPAEVYHPADFPAPGEPVTWHSVSA